MSQIFEATKTGAKDAALVAVGVPVVLLDRVSGRLIHRLHIDSVVSFVSLAREHGERALDSCGEAVDKMKYLVGAAPKVTAPSESVDNESVPVAKVSVPKAAAKKTLD